MEGGEWEGRRVLIDAMLLSACIEVTSSGSHVIRHKGNELEARGVHATRQVPHGRKRSNIIKHKGGGGEKYSSP